MKNVKCEYCGIGREIGDNWSSYECYDCGATNYRKKVELDEDIDKHIEPKHYSELGISPLEVIEANTHLTWALANSIKYILRAGLKENNPKIQDLKKAQWYLNHEIERMLDAD